MVVHSSDIIRHLLDHIVDEFCIDRIQRITKLELRPHQDTFLIGNIINEVWRVGPTGPYAQHVLIGGSDRIE